MAKTIEDKLAELPAETRAKIERRAASLIEEEMSLRELRNAMGRTQVMMAKKWGVGQDTVSRVEQRADMMLSTLRGYVRSAGGELDLVVRLPGRAPVRLTGLGDLARPARRGPDGPRTQRRRRRSVAQPVRNASE
jgi:DNA-binding XRE family transcriptional regulator